MAKETTGAPKRRAPETPGSADLVDATDHGALSVQEVAGTAPIPMTLAPTGEAERIGRYQVKGVLGRGGMGVVYEVHDPSERRDLALKTIETRFLELSDSAAEQRFRHEIRVLRRLEHTGIVRLFDTGFARHPLGYDLAYYVMEKLDGETLVKDIRANRKFPSMEAARIVSALAEALAYLEENGVLHRDIKPGNIFVTSEGRIVLLDFGLARSAELTRLTLAGQIVGTFSYMSPERLCGAKCDTAADVFALGVVWYQMLSGRHPFGTGAPTDLMAAIQRGVEWPDSILGLERGAEIRDMIESMLAMEPKYRPSAQEVQMRAGVLSRRHTRTAEPAVAATRTIALPVPSTMRTPQVGTVVTESGPSAAVKPSPATTSGPHAQVPLRGPDSQSSPFVASVSAVGSAAMVATVRWPIAALICGMCSSLAFAIGVLIGSGRPSADAPRYEAPRAEAPAPVTAPPVAPVKAPVAAPTAPVAEVARPVQRTKEPAPAVAPEEYKDFREAYQAAQEQINDGLHEAAIRSLQRTLELNPAFADAHRRLGDAHRALGRNERALHHYKLYLALRPEAPEAPAVRAAVERLGDGTN